MTSVQPQYQVQVEYAQDQFLHTSCLLGTTTCSIDCRTLLSRTEEEMRQRGSSSLNNFELSSLDILRRLDPERIRSEGTFPFRKIPGAVHRCCVIVGSRGGLSCSNCVEDLRQLSRDLKMKETIKNACVVVLSLIVGLAAFRFSGLI